SQNPRNPERSSNGRLPTDMAGGVVGTRLGGPGRRTLLSRGPVVLLGDHTGRGQGVMSLSRLKPAGTTGPSTVAITPGSRIPAAPSVTTSSIWQDCSEWGPGGGGFEYSGSRWTPSDSVEVRHESGSAESPLHSTLLEQVDEVGCQAVGADA